MEAGIEAGRQARRETLDACRRLKIDAVFVVRNLKRLAKFKGKKPFHFQGFISYSEPLEDPVVQLDAIKELATILDIYPRVDEAQDNGSSSLDALVTAIASGPVKRQDDNDAG
jgi:hypothetical protein